MYVIWSRFFSYDLYANAAQEQEYDSKARKTRFKGPLMRGVRVGQRDELTIAEAVWTNKKGKECRRKEYKGPVLIFATRDRSENVTYRAWPQGWSKPSSITTKHSNDIEAQWTKERLEDELTARNNVANALENAEASIDANEAISKIEAILTTQFTACYKRGIAHCASHGLLPLAQDESYSWPTQAINDGRQVFRRLQKQYSSDLFPSRESVAIAAQWYCDNYPELDQDLQGSEYLDAFLLWFHTLIYNAGGGKTQRNTLKDRIIPPTIDAEEMPWGDIMEWYNEGLDKNAIRSLKDMERLKYGSWIAAAALSGKRSHEYTWGVELPEHTTPVLRTPTGHPTRLDNHHEWRPVIYDNPSFYYEEATGNLAEQLEDPDAYPDARDALFEVVNKMEDYSHVMLVRTVWRDFLIPAGNRGDVWEIRKFGRLLELMVEDEPVGTWYREKERLDAEQAEEEQEEQEEEDEEDEEPGDLEEDERYDGVDQANASDEEYQERGDSASGVTGDAERRTAPLQSNSPEQ